MSQKPFNLNLENNLEPKYGTISIDELRKIQQYKEDNEKKVDLIPEAQFMVNDKELLQKVLVSTLTDTVKSKSRGRPKKFIH